MKKQKMKINFLANGTLNIFLAILVVILFVGGVYFYLKAKISKDSVIKVQQRTIKNLRKKVKRLGVAVFMSYDDVANKLRQSADRDERDKNRDKYND